MKPTVRSLAKYRGHRCLNCDTPLDIEDKYCHQCGQLNTTKRLALKDFINEFFANFISYDSRVWRTINHLLFRPGYVTEQYCAGKRMQYANPFRFFLTVSIVFFLLIQLSMNFNNEDSLKITDDSSKTNDTLNETEERKQLIADLKKTQKDSIKKAERNFIEDFALEQAIETIESDTINIKEERKYLTQSQLDEMNPVKGYFKQIADYLTFNKENPNKTREEALKKLGHHQNNINLKRYQKAMDFRDVSNNPDKPLSAIISRIPLFLFFLAPIMSLFFWLIYARRKWNYMEHMVFNFHILTFVFLGMYLTLLESSIFGTDIFSLIFFALIGPFYFYKALRKFYKQGRFKTILKFLLINFVFLVLLSISSTIFILASVFLSV